ncbi:iron complex outermembrane recepter protein [Dyella jiangningensis]|uniref:TonB-dependent receptor n=2 Tax=Gammaproteobacteria TaxID=1236 RepID=UPI00089018A5|nr:TonB-dependent receptor [Dyella sp. AtDHG13]PXV59001.1 iron complex outermembrane receptor protein [Dyella sp. AtDHG13]SDL30127.1 iron complex outermembrane recepter protein [Dyella jiangningensis]
MPKLTLRRTAIALATLASVHGGIVLADDLNPAVAAAPAADASANGSRDKAKTMEAVSVVASGETRQVQKVTSEDLQQLAPGTSPLKAIDKLPGVNFQAADPWGDYEWSTQITLHGFDQSRLGFTLDGIPLGNMSYGTTTGLQVTRAISSDNLSTVELAQGAGALGTASNTNLGGTIQFYSADPDTVAGARINQVIGSDSTTRTFVRLDTGDYHGFSMYVSYDHASTDKWKGYGDQRSDQVNLKSVYQWDGGSVSLFFDNSRRKEYDYMDLSLASQKALGWNWDYLQPDWGTAVQIANAYNGKGAYPSVLSPLPAGYDLVDSTYYAGGGIRRDNLAGLSGTFNLNDHATLNIGTYYHDNRGEGQWATPYVASSPTVPLAMRTTDYGLDRYGGTGSLNYTIGNNDIEVGFWAENAKTNQERNYFYLTGAYNYLSNFYENEEPFLRGFFQHYVTQTRMAYASDTIHLMDDRLTLNFGAKALGVTNAADSLVASSALAAGRIRASDGFLPQAGVNYKIDANQEVYASYSKNLSAYGFLPFSQSQAAFNASKSSLNPEQSQTFELGYRVHGDTIEASADAYYTRFTNRLLAVSPCSAVQTCSAILNNVGSVKSTGVDLAVIWRPVEHLRWLNSVSYDNSKYQDDYLNNGVVATDGKYVVGIPTWMFTSNVSYSFGGFTATLDGKYTGRRYITYINDSQVPSYWLFNAGVNYDVGALSFVKDLSLGLNVTNLLNKRYYATTGTNGYVASDPQGWNQTLMAGAPRQVFFNINAKF